jgi:hypothetical protein
MSAEAELASGFAYGMRRRLNHCRFRTPLRRKRCQYRKRGFEDRANFFCVPLVVLDLCDAA